MSSFLLQYLKNPKVGANLLKVGTLSDFLTSTVAKHQKIEGVTLWGKNFFEKSSHDAEKKLNGGPFGIFQHPFTKKLKGDPLRKFFLKTKSHNAGKKLKRGPFSPARYCRLRGKTAKTFLVQFVRPNSSI